MSGTVSKMPGGLFTNEEWISSDVRPHGEEVQVPFSCNHQLKQQPKPGGFIFQVLAVGLPEHTLGAISAQCNIGPKWHLGPNGFFERFLGATRWLPCLGAFEDAPT